MVDVQGVVMVRRGCDEADFWGQKQRQAVATDNIVLLEQAQSYLRRYPLL